MKGTSDVALKSSVRSLALLFVILLFAIAACAQWVPLGPEGGDVRSLAYDPRDPDRVVLGTSAGQLFLSVNGGRTWTRWVHLGPADAYVLDNIAFDPTNPNTIYVAAWSVEAQNDGDLYRSKDGGKSWELIKPMRGKSIRAMALAQTDSKNITVGTLDGVFRSFDGGDSWQRISPESNVEIRNIESIAVDAKNPNVVYAGTWHLPWKTDDGGKTWHNIKKGVIDDSDVFSIIIDHSNSSVVYASACSGIYRSESAGELFHKIQGIPATARRTRVLQQDPVNANVVYAGTTEGLWKTIDSGKTFKRVSAPNYIINDVMIDPRNPSRLLVATDRSGVLASEDAGTTFRASNAGFSHRQVSRILVDRSDARTLYASVVNDKEFGGVFVSRDAGDKWTQVSEGLGGRDVFDISQSANGALVAATNRGVFGLAAKSNAWMPLNTVVTEKKLPSPKPRRTKSGKLIPVAAPKAELVKSELNARVTQIDVRGARWIAATTAGLFVSRDEGKSWTGGAVLGEREFVSVRSDGDKVLAASPSKLLFSRDGGATWEALNSPYFLSRIYAVTIASKSTLWMATREGAWRSNDDGKSWVHIIEGLPGRNILSIEADASGKRLLATAFGSRAIYESRDGGQTWKPSPDSGLSIRSVVDFNGRLLAATAYNGIVMHAGSETTRTGGERSSGGGSR